MDQEVFSLNRKVLKRYKNQWANYLHPNRISWRRDLYRFVLMELQELFDASLIGISVCCSKCKHANPLGCINNVASPGCAIYDDEALDRGDEDAFC